MATVNGTNLVIRIIDGTYKGEATLSTAVPGSPTDKDYYIVREAGDYSSWDAGIVEQVEVGEILYYESTAWVNKGVSGGGIIACSTSCTLTLNQSFTEVTCKDSEWVSQVEGQKSWEIAVDALYQDTDVAGSSGFVDISSLIVTGPNITHLAFEEINNPSATTNGNTWSGMARLSTCNLTGEDKSQATYSATFPGEGPLTYTAKA